jgi:uncharacterized protein (TIGR02444 family)
MKAAAPFAQWGDDAYRKPGVEQLALRLQDECGLNVVFLLWCLWCAAHFGEPSPAILRRALEATQHWSAGVVDPLRAARRFLRTPPREARAEPAAALRDRIKDAELAAERILQDMLERLAETHFRPAPGEASARARRLLAAYIRQTGAAQRPSFSVSLIEELIARTLDGLDSDAP